uniref:HMG box domain-containing protein n=1 Tax=Ditylenchus dipsaci TaxID=166011 RepID=A0A915ENS8_9BILA
MPKKSAALKDPNAPKRPLTAYFLWLKDNRSRISTPGMTAPQIAKQAGQEWNALADKSPWQKMAEQEKKQYEVAKAQYDSVK